MKKLVIRDDNMFRYLSNEPMPVLPEGLSVPIEMKTASELMNERDEWLKNSVRCECCGGKGRVAKASAILPHQQNTTQEKT